jgi:hypothetical protein
LRLCYSQTHDQTIQNQKKTHRNQQNAKQTKAQEQEEEAQ